MFSNRPYTHSEMDVSKEIVASAEALHEVILKVAPSRERSLAITKLEEAIMWANKAIKTGGVL